MRLIINALGERFIILSLRKEIREPAECQWVPFFMQKLLPLIAPPAFLSLFKYLKCYIFDFQQFLS